MRCRVILALPIMVVAGLTACGGGSEEDDAALKAQAKADSLAMAEALYDVAVFDTVSWESDAARLERGALVYRSSCGKCHGSRGGGNGEVAMEFGLEVPSFESPDWAYRGDIEGLRHRIFVGHEGAMPNWGLHGLKYRDVDAVAAHIAETISPAETAEAGG
jgi:mono/diheme cytochrome c family protein